MTTLFETGILPTPSAVTLRPYQQDAVERVYQEWNGYTDKEGERHEPVTSTLMVLPTGCGKTVCFSEIIRRRPPGKAMVIAHREELIYQGKTTIEAVTGTIASIEMADNYAMDTNIVVATVQTLSRGRMDWFRPNDFSLLVIDEAHHATADTYSKVHEYFKGNPNLKILGVTATPDRADEEALGQVFQSVAYDYELPDAVRDGWLVPIMASSVQVAGLDYSHIRTTAGDLNGADLEAVLTAEEPLHRMGQAIVELGMGLSPQALAPLLALPPDEFTCAMAEKVGASRLRKSLVFTVTVKHAEAMCEILNRWIPECARFVCGKTPKDERKKLFADFKDGVFNILCNVGVATEGFDEPTIEVIVLGRPTKSRALYSQMIGRGTRALLGTVDGPQTPELRRAAIAASAKPKIDIIDFSGNTGRHRLVSAADILGGNYTDDVIEEAEKITKDAKGEPVDVAESLEQAMRQVEERKAKEVARRAKLKARADYQIGETFDPLELLGVNKYRERGWEKNRQPTDKMRAWAEKSGIKTEGMSYSQVRQICQGMAKRIDAGLCSVKQAKILTRNGFSASTAFADAKKIIDVLAANNWHWPANMPRPTQEGGA